jgi:hypothetical protein
MAAIYGHNVAFPLSRVFGPVRLNSAEFVDSVVAYQFDLWQWRRARLAV